LRGPVPRGRLALALLLAVPALLAGCPRARSAPRNILLLTLDTTRADALSCSGNARASTPFLDQVAEEGVQLDRMFSASPVTLPSHATILTGTYPLWHGARDNGGYRLDGSNVTLAEILAAEGFRTGAFIAAFPLDRRFGTDQGFDHYDDDLSRGRRAASFTFTERGAAAIVDSFLSWDGWRGEDPFFAWLHFFDAHAPYVPPPQALARVSDPYLAEVSGVDEEIGRLLDVLRREGVLDDTLLVVVGDHGEGLGDPHDELSHGIYLYDETIRVPCLIRHPGSLPRGRVFDAPVSTVDLLPTMLELLSVDVPGVAQGQSLVSHFRGQPWTDADRPIYAETILPHGQFGWSALCSVRDARWKYVRAPRSELYDLVEDPREQQNLIDSHPEVAAKMEQKLGAVRTAMSRDLSSLGHFAVDAEAVRALEALGYLQGTRQEGTAREDPLEVALKRNRDPKDFVRSYVLVEDARMLQREKRPDEAERLYRTALDIDPENLEALTNYGVLLLHEQRLVEAKGLLQKVIDLAPGNAGGHYGMGFVKDELCKAAAEAGDELAADQLSKEAQRSYLEAVRLDPYHVDARLNLGNLLFRTGHPREAEEQFREIFEIEPTASKAHRNLAAVLVSEDRHEEAIREFQEVLVREPDDLVVRWHLALSLEKTGRLREALSVLEGLARVRPRDPEVAEAVKRVRQTLSSGG